MWPEAWSWREEQTRKAAGIKLDPEKYNLYTGTYFNDEWKDTRIILREGNKLMGREGENGPKIELIPQSELHFLAPGWVLPVTFVKDKDGHITEIVEDSGEGGVYKKIK